MSNELYAHECIGMSGGGCFLNTLLLKRLAEISTVKEVHIFDLHAPTVTSNKFIFHRIDLTQDNATFDLSEILIQNKVTAFFHGALFSGPTRNPSSHHEVESIGTFHVLNAMAAAKIKRFIVKSDTFVYGAHPKNPNFIRESFHLKAQGGPYFVKTRVDVEMQIQDFADNYPDCEVAVLRFAPILGPNSNNIRARYFLAGLVPKVLGYDPLMQFIHEEDAVRAAMLAFASKARGIFNVVGKGVIPLSTGVHLAGKFPVPFASLMCKTFFSAGYFLRIWDLPKEMVPFFQYLCVADGKKSQRELKFEPKYSSRQALKSMIEADRLRSVGFATPSSLLGEDKAYARLHGFEKIN